VLTREFPHSRNSNILKYEFSTFVYAAGSPFPLEVVCPTVVLLCAACREKKAQSVVLVSRPQIADLTSELADERFKGDVACQALESERAERLQALREVQELKVRAHGHLVGCLEVVDPGYWCSSGTRHPK